jgi:ribonuclease-3
MELAALETRLGYTFAQHTLLEQAVTHRSHGSVHNERLEFLGDAVLNCAIAQLLFAKYARLDEGDLSRLRANLVKQQSLAEIAEKLVLSDFMRLGEGEMKSGGFRRPSILADTMEAFSARSSSTAARRGARSDRQAVRPGAEDGGPEGLARTARHCCRMPAGQADCAARLHGRRDARRGSQPGVRG